LARIFNFFEKKRELRNGAAPRRAAPAAMTMETSTTAPPPRGAGIIVIFFPGINPAGNYNIQFGNMSSNTANARGRQGQSNAANSSASWSDERRSGELLDAYIGAPMRLSQD
jgi:hypothetical protein